jgi:polyhydroxyalkanoate synthesis repressor PhaR
VETGTDGGGRVVKRYANRKLYDTRESRYVTLQQIAELVRAGEEVRIIDNKSKEDLTDVTLAQIIYEEQKNKVEGQARSLKTLRALIEQGGERLMTSLRDGPMGKLVRKGGPDGLDEEVPSEPAMARDQKSLIRQSREAFDELQRLADDRMRSLVGRAADQVQQLHAEIARLSARIEELEDRLRRASRRVEDSDPE